MFTEAHESWQRFEKEVAQTGSVWPSDQARQVRALIWSHIGAMAAENEDNEPDGLFLPFAPPRKKRDSEFRPSAEECLRKSLELAPESLMAHRNLFRYLLTKAKKSGPVFAAGTKLLEHFPDHVETLQALGGLCAQEMRFEEAQGYLQRALSANPLERGLRTQLIHVHAMRARELSCGKRFDEARASCQAALSLFDTPGKYPLHCLHAVVELKAKNGPRYEELLAEAQKDAGHRLPVVYSLMCESIRQKLTPAQKKPFAQEFQTALAGKVDPAAIPQLLGTLVSQRLAGPAYTGQKTHEKKVMALVEKADFKRYEEEVVEGMCETLLGLESLKTLKRCIARARKRFPANAALMLIEADTWLQGRCNEYRCGLLLNQARKHIEQLPRGDRQQRLLERLQDLDERLREMDGLHNFMSRMMDMFDDDEDDS
jgi:tetratricopeptide (TPR) repeat protein